MIRPNNFIMLSLTLVWLLLASCAPNSDGTIKERPGNNRSSSEAYCDANCVEFAEDGSCLKHTENFARACADRIKGTPVRIFFGTDRKNDGTNQSPVFGADRSRGLQLGQVIVSVPKAHRAGRIERPSWLLTKFSFDEETSGKHFIMEPPVLHSSDWFTHTLKNLMTTSETGKRQAFVFIHGFNMTFEEAAWRTAQIAYDLQFDGVPLFYSWPSRGDLGAYVYDQNSARQARDTLEEFLDLIKKQSGADIVHLIGHSMGTNPLMEVAAKMWRERRDDLSEPLFNQIVLAAADIDQDVFFDLADQLEGAAEGITVYASGNDRALDLSREIGGGIPRIGDVPARGPSVHPDIDMIDATYLDTEFFGLNHDGYTNHRPLLDDIGLLLEHGLRPPNRRTRNMLAVSAVGGSYWQYLP